TPDLRASRRRFVRLPTSRPRYSARTIAWAFATCADTSATTACFSVRLRPKVLLLFVATAAHPLRAVRPLGDLPSGVPSPLERCLSGEAQILHWVRHLRRSPVRLSEDDGRAAAYPTAFPGD